MFETPEKAERRLASDVELKDEQRAKRSRTDDVENSDPGAAASAASGAGAASKAAAGHGTPAVAHQVEGSASGSRRRPFRVPLFRVYLLVHELTPGCYGCPCIRKGAKICGHSERCRERMEALLAQDPAGKARLEEAKRRLARYVELTGRWTRAPKGGVGSFDPAKHWRLFTPSVVDESKCLARRWGKGIGLQCTRFPLPGARVCGRHCKFQTHGLVTGGIPPAKLREFLKA